MSQKESSSSKSNTRHKRAHQDDDSGSNTDGVVCMNAKRNKGAYESDTPSKHQSSASSHANIALPAEAFMAGPSSGQPTQPKLAQLDPPQNQNKARSSSNLRKSPPRIVVCTSLVSSKNLKRKSARIKWNFYEVESIQAAEFVKKDGCVKYRVHWKDYDESKDTLEPLENLFSLLSLRTYVEQIIEESEANHRKTATNSLMECNISDAIRAKIDQRSKRMLGINEKQDSGENCQEFETTNIIAVMACLMKDTLFVMRSNNFVARLKLKDLTVEELRSILPLLGAQYNAWLDPKGANYDSGVDCRRDDYASISHNTSLNELDMEASHVPDKVTTVAKEISPNDDHQKKFEPNRTSTQETIAENEDESPQLTTPNPVQPSNTAAADEIDHFSGSSSTAVDNSTPAESSSTNLDGSCRHEAQIHRTPSTSSSTVSLFSATSSPALPVPPSHQTSPNSVTNGSASGNSSKLKILILPDHPTIHGLLENARKNVEFDLISSLRNIYTMHEWPANFFDPTSSATGVLPRITVGLLVTESKEGKVVGISVLSQAPVPEVTIPDAAISQDCTTSASTLQTSTPESPGTGSKDYPPELCSSIGYPSTAIANIDDDAQLTVRPKQPLAPVNRITTRRTALAGLDEKEHYLHELRRIIKNNWQGNIAIKFHPNLPHFGNDLPKNRVLLLCDTCGRIFNNYYLLAFNHFSKYNHLGFVLHEGAQFETDEERTYFVQSSN